MADEVESTTGAEAGGNSIATTPGRNNNNLVAGFGNLNVLRQGGLMIGLAVAVAVGYAIVRWTQEEDYRPLYGSLDRLDSSEVLNILEFSDISYKIDSNSGALLVAADDVNKARLQLAEAGLSGEQSVGFELLDQEQPLGSSQFMENARYRRSLEGELARTITSIHAVRSARVHLAIPKSSVFVRDAREPRASVFVELFPGRAIKKQQLQAIANLVASSIPELELENVTIVDQKGQLYEPEDDSSEFTLAAKQREYVKGIEKDYTRRVNSIIEPITGIENFRAEVSADIDFTAVEQAAEVFNPDLPAVRSEQTLQESRANGAEIAGIPGALSNQPPGVGVVPEQVDPQTGEPISNEPRNTRNQATRNFELDRTLSYTKHQVGRLQRLTVAVVVNDKTTVDTVSGEEVSTPWSESELERMSILVRDAVGFSAARGDSINIINTPFLNIEEEPLVVEETPLWLQDWFQSLAKQGLGGLLVLVLLFGLLRPVLKNLALSGLRAKEMEDARELQALESAGLNNMDSLSDETVTLSGGGSLNLPNPEQGYEQRLNVVKDIIAEDPGRVAQVVKRWVVEE